MQECKSYLFFGNLTKISISVLNFSTESTEKQYRDFCKLQYILLKMIINLPLKCEINIRVVTLFWDPFRQQV